MLKKPTKNFPSEIYYGDILEFKMMFSVEKCERVERNDVLQSRT